MPPTGRRAPLFHDVAAGRPDAPPPSGVQSYNEVSFVDLVTGEHFGMAVDYQPREVQFTPDGKLAAVVTKTSLGVVMLPTATCQRAASATTGPATASIAGSEGVENGA